MATYLIALLLALHGLIHGLGFAAVWLEGPSAVSRTPTLVGGIDPGGPLLRVLGVLWLLPLLAFVAASLGLVLDSAWWRPLLVAAALV